MFRRFAAIVVVVSLLAIAVGGGALYYFGFKVKETPTCMNFMASVPAGMAAKFQSDLQNVVLPGLSLRAERDSARTWESDKVRVSHYLSRNGVDHSIFVCSKNQDSTVWQEASLKVQRVLQQSAPMFKAWLQINEHDYECGASCDADVSPPLDFEILNRTLLVRKATK